MKRKKKQLLVTIPAPMPDFYFNLSSPKVIAGKLKQIRKLLKTHKIRKLSMKDKNLFLGGDIL